MTWKPEVGAYRKEYGHTDAFRQWACAVVAEAVSSLYLRGLSIATQPMMPG